MVSGLRLPLDAVPPGRLEGRKTIRVCPDDVAD